MIFANRHQAGELLAREIAKRKLNSRNTIIAAIPRGGVVVADAISSKLGLLLLAVVIKKLGAPHNSELAIGAIASHGTAVLDQWLIRDLKVSSQWLKKEKIKKRKEAAEREKFLGVETSRDKFRGRDVIVVDDGLATGQTARAAAKIIREFGAKRIILAIPCASPSVLEMIKEDFDEVICLEIDPNLEAVGQYYRDFRPTSEEEVKEILETRL